MTDTDELRPGQVVHKTGNADVEVREVTGRILDELFHNGRNEEPSLPRPRLDEQHPDVRVLGEA